MSETLLKAGQHFRAVKGDARVFRVVCFHKNERGTAYCVDLFRKDGKLVGGMEWYSETAIRQWPKFKIEPESLEGF